MTPAGIEPATFRFVAQHLNHCATANIKPLEDVIACIRYPRIRGENVRKVKGLKNNRR